MKQRQTGFSGTQRFNTFGANQNMILGINKSGKLLKEFILLNIEDNEHGFYVDQPLIKNLLLSDMITVEPNGKVRVGK